MTGALLAALVVSACARAVEPERPARAEPRRVESNILRADYAGSEACRHCHADIYATHMKSAMHRMTRAAASAELRAPFDGRSLELGGDVATLYQRDGERLMRLQTRRSGAQLYRITKVIGGRHREDFVGIDVAEEAGRRRAHGAERVLPVSYVYETDTLRYKGYSVMIPERPELRTGARWAATCIGCHNTLPYLSMLYDDLRGPGAEPYQGSVTDGLLPTDRAFAVTATDEARLAEAIAAELEAIGAGAGELGGESLAGLLDHAIKGTRQRLRGEHLIELGVGCEACHGGAREHVENFRVLPSFELRSPLLRARPASGRAASTAEHANRICMRCHTVLFSEYPWTWEGGRRSDPLPGGSSTNSGEARDFMLGGCARELTCTTCHDPHGVDHRAELAALATPAGNAACVRCHAELAEPRAMAAHSHHPPDSAGNACVACHMPKKNSALDYRLTRYHRIGSPSDDARVLADRPIECALCHHEESTERLVEAMEAWWGGHYDRRRLRGLYGDLSRPNLAATLERGKPHEQMAAIGALGEQADARAVELIAPHLAHDYPLVRFFAKRAIERLTGQPLDVDVQAPGAAIRADLAERAAQTEGARPAAAPR